MVIILCNIRREMLLPVPPTRIGDHQWRRLIFHRFYCWVLWGTKGPDMTVKLALSKRPWLKESFSITDLLQTHYQAFHHSQFLEILSLDGPEKKFFFNPWVSADPTLSAYVLAISDLRRWKQHKMLPPRSCFEFFFSRKSWKDDKDILST